MSLDPVTTNPDLYSVVFENDRVRVLEYSDRPGTASTPHHHPDSVMITLSSFRRRLSVPGRSIEVDMTAGTPQWLPAQVHSGENIGDTDTHVLLVELMEGASDGGSGVGEGQLPLGPVLGRPHS